MFEKLARIISPQNKLILMLEFKDLCKTQPKLLTQENYDKVRKKCPKIIQNQNNDNFDEAV
jgi:hypothetical protein